MASSKPKNKRTLLELFSHILKRKSRTGHSNPEDVPLPSRAVAAVMTKWLIPSVSALFVTIGYVVVSSHQSLIGIELENVNTSDFITAAAGFFRDLLIILPDAALDSPTWLRFLYSDISRFGLTISLLLFIIGFWVAGKQQFLEKAHPLKQRALILILVLFVFCKFIVLDAPLASLENVLMSAGNGSGDLTKMLPIEKRLEFEEKANGLKGYVSARASSIWTDMVCMRVSTDILESKHIPCKKDNAASQKRIRSEFLTYSFISVLFLILSCQTLRRSATPPVVVVSLIAVFYVLTWPHAYGKLLKTTSYKFGEVRFKTNLEDAHGTPIANEKSRQAIVLAQDARSYKLLVEKEGAKACPDGYSNTEVKLWEISNSEVISIKEIYQEDVIAWKILHEKPCAGLPITKRKVIGGG